MEEKYLRILSRQFPTEQAAATEIINLPVHSFPSEGNGTFLTDIHGEAEQFQHVLKNGSGTVKRKVEAVIGQKKPGHIKDS